jgi:hypothetical protein
MSRDAENLEALCLRLGIEYEPDDGDTRRRLAMWEKIGRADAAPIDTPSKEATLDALDRLHLARKQAEKKARADLAIVAQYLRYGGIPDMKVLHLLADWIDPAKARRGGRPPGAIERAYDDACIFHEVEAQLARGLDKKAAYSAVARREPASGRSNENPEEAVADAYRRVVAKKRAIAPANVGTQVRIVIGDHAEWQARLRKQLEEERLAKAGEKPRQRRQASARKRTETARSGRKG